MPDSGIYPLSPVLSHLLLCLLALRYLLSLVVLLCDYNIWSSVFDHVVRLDTYIPEDFDFLRLYSLVQPFVDMMPLFRVGFAFRTDPNGQFRQLCHVSSYIPVAPVYCIHSVGARLFLPCPCIFCISDPLLL